MNPQRFQSVNMLDEKYVYERREKSVIIIKYERHAYTTPIPLRLERLM